MRDDVMSKQNNIEDAPIRAGLAIRQLLSIQYIYYVTISTIQAAKLKNPLRFISKNASLIASSITS